MKFYRELLVMNSWQNNTLANSCIIRHESKKTCILQDKPFEMICKYER